MADSNEERQKRDDEIRQTVMAKLVETGEKDKLKEMIRDKLVSCGWRDELKEFCKEVIRRKGKINLYLQSKVLWDNKKSCQI